MCFLLYKYHKAISPMKQGLFQPFAKCCLFLPEDAATELKSGAGGGYNITV
jgi:hypothetical protein